MSAPSRALESLTATYTDSEGEDGMDDDSQDNSNTPKGAAPPPDEAGSLTPKSDSSTSNSQTSATNTNSRNNFPNDAPPVVDLTPPRVQRLVSYFDDTVVSDEEGTATGNSKVQIPVNGKSDQNSGRHTPDSQDSVVNDKDEDDGVVIPPDPPGSCSVELQNKVKTLFRRMEAGTDMNKAIQDKKEYRNPSIYEKLIQFCGINELGTNYPPDRFDPFKWGKDSYYEELAKAQKVEMEKLEKARKDKAEKTKIEIVVGTAKRTSAAAAAAAAAEAEAKKRKSKWDQIPQNPLLTTQPAATAAVTTTKPTVISAFGSLPKKRL
ncbi:hypothetical protein QAD02_004844 [Eretmocerus hayati]|uniref:Uncharacterized protein n=1 Tax=Eretmocerus hayati TaxID=131215 RepID=A0ACC2NR48_9HYME|nr:hypothetical protein QAD02_004844 [Eretmocerus hayati]